MGLLIYSAADPGSAFSSDGNLEDPLFHAFDGTSGGVKQVRYYVRNDDSSVYYTNITITPVLISGDNIFDGTDGFGWKMIAGDTQPLEEQWGLVGDGNSISIPNIGSVSAGDITTYEPFWLRIVVPRGADVKSHTGIKLRIAGTVTLVP